MPLPPNVRRFLAFRVLFNARFYYPVLAVLFVDLGLTLDQYALLNVAWAASIIFFELPLGALADRVGRRPLVVGAGALMVVEMSVLAFAPTGNPTLLFLVFLVNRILSGAAEAAASGADEALAYDTLVAEGRTTEWPNVLAHLQRLMAAAMILSMMLGAALYDSGFMSAVTGTTLAQLTTARFPIYLTLVLSLGALFVAWRMEEPDVGEKPAARPSLREGWASVLAAGRWIRAAPFALAIIGFWLAIDSVVRLFMTLSSSYFRMISIPEGLFGVLGAMFAAIGFFSPTLAHWLLRRGSPLAGFGVVTAIVLVGLVGVALAGSWVGVVFVAVLGFGWHVLGFLGSHFLNKVTDSSRRATVLSFKSLAGNLAYGGVGVAYALAFRMLGSGTPTPGLAEIVLSRTLVWFPVALLLLLGPLFVWARRIPSMRGA
jgi:MFS family permease